MAYRKLALIVRKCRANRPNRLWPKKAEVASNRRVAPISIPTGGGCKGSPTAPVGPPRNGVGNMKTHDLSEIGFDRTKIVGRTAQMATAERAKIASILLVAPIFIPIRGHRSREADKTTSRDENRHIILESTPMLNKLLLTLLLCSAAFAQTAGIDIPYKKFVLDNGLTVIVHEDHKAPIVAVNIWYHVGSKNEKPGKTGFAHLFEHLMFGGSENFHGRYI